MADFVEEPFTVITPRTKHQLSCIFHRKTSPFVDDENREHVVVFCHGYLSNKNGVFFPQLSRELRYHSVRFDFHGCGQSTGRDGWDYGGYEDETKDDLRTIVEHLRNAEKKYFVRALVGHSRAGSTVLLYGTYYDDIPIIVNVAGRYRLDRGITERFTEEQRAELEKTGSFIIHTAFDGDFPITNEAIERRRNLDLKQIEKIRNAKVLNLWGDLDNVIPGEDIFLFHQQLQACKETKMIIVPGADHCFVGEENELIRLIQDWI